MLNLSCADFTIPLCFVQSISWQRRARTVQHIGGYVTARGFEAAEISVKLHIDFGVCKAYGVDPQTIYSLIDSTVTNRTAKSGLFTLGKYTVYPTLEFALTNINKTYSPDIGIIECDCVWSGVKAVKNVARENALTIDPTQTMPELTLSVGGKSLVLQDFCSISELKTNPDSISLSMMIGSDMDLINRDGFMVDLLSGTVDAALPQGTTKYYIIQADLTDEQLSITGSIYPPQAAKVITKTYQDTTLKAVILDLCKEMGVDCDCMVDGTVGYYLAFGKPLDCIKALQGGAGFIMSLRQGHLTCVDVPSALNAVDELQYIQMAQDTDTEPISGCYWFDGINQRTAGKLDASSIRIYSPFRSTGDYADKALKLARYNKNMIVVQSEILQTLDTHSVVSIQSNDTILDCMAEWIEFDWLNNAMSVELHYIGG